MNLQKYPRLRTVDKIKPPFPLNKFPKSFGYRVGEEVAYLLATKGSPVLEGREWEEIFANCIGAQWKPSNVGLDDVISRGCAWGAKTVKSNAPAKQDKVRLISGRNSLIYSFNTTEIGSVHPDSLGEKILSIWNERVYMIWKKYKHVRTVVLIKSNDLSEVMVFEFETIRYDPECFTWKWNKNNNLEGFSKVETKHCFTWQPHGSQFTIIEKVPRDSLIVKIKLPKRLNKKSILRSIGFDKSWIAISKNR